MTASEYANDLLDKKMVRETEVYFLDVLSVLIVIIVSYKEVASLAATTVSFFR